MKKYFLKCGYFLMCFCLPLIVFANPKTDNERFFIRLSQAPLSQTLEQLAFQQDVNLVIGDTLENKISLKLNNINMPRLLQIIAKSKKLTLNKDEGIYYLNGRQVAGNLTTNEPHLVSHTVKLHFAKASELMKSLTTGSGSLLSSAGSITFDDRSNLLVIQDDPRSVQNIKKLIAEMDKPIEQIAIEARIVTITDESLKELGVRWGIFNPTENARRVAGSLAGNSFENIADNLNVNFATTTTPAGSIALQVAKINGRLLDLELSALERENNVEIIASPRLLTTNKKSASIKQGTEIPYVVSNTRNDTQSVEFREAVLGLEVTPHISKDNNILLDLLVSQNSPGSRVSYGQNEVVSIDKQEINTQVFAKDGETIVLGGVFHDTITKSEDKVPLLGDIPVIKRLFSKESERHQKRELVIFVTPHILKAGETLDSLKQKSAGKKLQ
ncbi:Type IV pilus biogenesis and competence protein PilQ precursor [Haemophilus influenzae]|uniref:type IV pilus secretin PilQ n=1 Tax=Haemophilus influenzae TaxID=727 RepID=UPI000D011BF7|nr:type IV pilus secretin PilQ [Haemophilus influenzae]PRJ90605.1 Type IV pilus biogenesis and competence protein PilQ precursor [Haemophilus influenzae]PRK61337.1 Type IV pilus biogenesis and competence protein PilQ precursor [Haemophilus influenzae]PRM07309.1 Type IV pilus biogenesis and competence protein PilQ precursor [Haemophilus influenzae]